jgi:hypothetical protein
MELELFVCAVEEVFREMFVDLMEFVFGSAGSGFVVSCVVDNNFICLIRFIFPVFKINLPAFLIYV